MLRMAERGAFRPLWSERVTEEALRALVRIHPDIDVSRFQSRFHSMNESFDDAMVEGWEPLVAGLELPDPDDRHVLAAAIVGRADVIVTENTKDFPAGVLGPLGIEAMRLDHFLLDQFDLNPAIAALIVSEQAAAARRPKITAGLLLDRLSRSGAPQFAGAVGEELAKDEVAEYSEENGEQAETA